MKRMKNYLGLELIDNSRSLFSSVPPLLSFFILFTSFFCFFFLSFIPSYFLSFHPSFSCSLSQSFFLFSLTFFPIHTLTLPIPLFSSPSSLFRSHFHLLFPLFLSFISLHFFLSLFVSLSTVPFLFYCPFLYLSLLTLFFSLSHTYSQFLEF